MRHLGIDQKPSISLTSRAVQETGATSHPAADGSQPSGDPNCSSSHAPDLLSSPPAAPNDAEDPFVAGDRNGRFIAVSSIPYYEPPPLARLFPPMSDADRAALTESVRTTGLHHPIVVHEDKILD